MTSSGITPVFDLTGRRLGQRKKNRHRTVAVVAATAIHLVLFVVAFSSAAGGPVSGGGGVESLDANAVTVSLAGYNFPKAEEPHDRTAANFDALFAKVRVDQAPVVIEAAPAPSAKTNLDQLFDELDRSNRASARQGKSDQDKGGGGKATTGANQTAEDLQGNDPARAQAGQSGDNASTGALWGQVAPCWRRMPKVSSVPVTLDVTLDSSGRISTPPKIVRPADAALTEQRLTSEARALAALSACVPYRGVPLAKHPIRLSFPALAPTHSSLIQPRI